MNTSRQPARMLAALLATVMATAPVWAEKPEWAGQGKGKEQKEQRQPKAERGDRAERGGERAQRKPDAVRTEVRVGAFFSDQHRSAARTYYGEHYGGGKGCPPGLAKKNNGCMPPGQAKKWVVGQPLPAGVVVYPVPAAVIVHLPPAPVGYKYVRVATDILLIAVGTQMVIDGISDLMRL